MQLAACFKVSAVQTLLTSRLAHLHSTVAARLSGRVKHETKQAPIYRRSIFSFDTIVSNHISIKVRQILY